MKKKILMSIAITIAAAKLFANIFADENPTTSKEPNSKMNTENAILLVTFGSTYPNAQKAYDNIDRLAKEQFKDYTILWAYTSNKVRKKLSGQGIKIYSIAEVLSKLKEENYKNIYIQSLHIIPGREYSKIIADAEKFKDSFETIKISPPLLYSYKDLENTTDIILSKLPSERRTEDAVLFMGHGSEKHFSDLIYAAAAYVLQKKDPLAFIACVEGNPPFDSILDELKSKEVKKTYLIPFMSVAGDHSLNDMAGDDDDSWKSVLAENSIKAVPVIKGLAEYDEIVNIWLSHLENTINSAAFKE